VTFTTGGVDIGGTFTDCILIDENGRIYSGKAPTTRGALAEGFMAALEAAAGKTGLTLREVLGELRFLAHGTTVATNIMVQRAGARTALITTRGHGDAVFIQRAAGRVAGLPREHLLDLLRGRKPEPLVPRSLVFEVDERTDASGNVVVELDQDGVRDAVQQAIAAGASAIAVSFLWSFQNPTNERLARAAVESEVGHTNTFVSVSHEVAPSWGEYERTMSAIINCYTGPETAAYIGEIERELRERGFHGSFSVMKSDGGVATAAEAARRPVTLLSSGPAGALSATQRLLEALGETDAITTDMGGTSLDIGMIVGGRPLTVETSVAERFEFHLPALDIVSIGSGGGSVAWVDSTSGTLKVGPQSAGASPGPAAYGLGGTEPTVTDANVVLGYINPEYFLGGTIRLDRELSERAVEQVGAQLGMSTLEAAAGIRTIVDSQMAAAIRTQSIARGYDPRNFTLFAFGGGGAAHAADYARELGVKRVVIPLADISSLWSAVGVAIADIIHVEEQAAALTEPFDADAIRRALVDVAERCRDRVVGQRIDPSEVTVEITAKMKYRLQVHAIDVPIEFDALPDCEALIARFGERYAELYGAGAGYREAGIEITGFRATGVGPRISSRELSVAAIDAPDSTSDRALPRDVYWVGFGDLETAVYRADNLTNDWATDGPAIIELPDTTVLVPPDFAASIDPLGNVVLQQVAAAGGAQVVEFAATSLADQRIAQ
jgi:N-methylhydantoinase A